MRDGEDSDQAGVDQNGVFAARARSSNTPFLTPLWPRRGRLMWLSLVEEVNEADNRGADEDSSDHPPNQCVSPAAPLAPRGPAQGFTVIARYSMTVAKSFYADKYS